MATNGKVQQTKQQKAIAALLTAPDVASAARQAGLGERTLYRWLHEDGDFQAALRAAETAALDDVVRRMAGAAGDAVTVLSSLMNGATTPPAVRARAALGLLDHLVRLREWHKLEERLDHLEAAVDGSGRLC